VPAPVGGRLPLGGRNVTTLVYQTGRPNRIDYSNVSGTIGQVASQDWRLRSSVGVPVSAESRLWGCIVVAFSRQGGCCRPAPRRAWPPSPNWWRQRSRIPSHVRLSPRLAEEQIDETTGTNRHAARHGARGDRHDDSPGRLTRACPSARLRHLAGRRERARRRDDSVPLRSAGSMSMPTVADELHRRTMLSPCSPRWPRATPAQVALAWLLGLAPNILLIPGTP
jgi:hypothetical protein